MIRARLLPLLPLLVALPPACQDTAAHRAVYRDAIDDFRARYSTASADGPGGAELREMARSALAAARARGALTLEDCFTAAVETSETLAIAGEAYLQQRFLYDEAIAAVLPSIRAGVTEFYQDPVKMPGTSGAGSVVTLTDEHRQVAVTFTQPLFKGLREYAALRQQTQVEEARRQDIGTSLRTLYLDVARVFYETLGSEADTRTYEATVRLEEERFREIQARWQQGLARRTELLLVESQLESDRAKLVSARNALRQSRLQLAFLLGGPADMPLQDVIPDLPAPPDPAPLLETARVHRSDLLAREAELRAAAEQVDIARGEYWGSIDLTGSWYAYRYGYSDFQKEIDYDILLSYTLPLFEGGATKARHASALSTVRQAEYARDAVRRQIEVDVRSAHLDLISAEAQLKNLEASLRSSDENFRLIQEEYRQGLATNLEVQTANDLLTQVRLALDRQRFARKVTWIQLRAAQGLLPERAGR